MARRGGMMTALQAALAGFSGGIEGRVQQQAADEERSRVAAALARQQGLDALAMEDRTLAKEDREQEKADRLRSQRLSLLKSGYVPDGLDMPGATPRTPVSTEMVGGQRFSAYETPQQMARRAAIEEATLKAKMKPEPSMTPYQQAMLEQRRLDREARGTRASKSGAASSGALKDAGGMKPQTAADAAKEAQGLAYLRDNAQNQDLMLDIQAAIEANPELASRPGTIAYGLMQRAERKAKADLSASKPKTGGRTLSAPPGMTPAASKKVDPLDEAFDKWSK